MKNRIFGITALLAVVVLGLAFISCPADAEDCELTFINHTATIITISTDGSPASFTLQKATSVLDDSKSQKVTKKAPEIKITSISFEGMSSEQWDRFVRLQLNAKPNEKVKKGLALGPGSVYFLATDRDTDGSVWAGNTNPAAFTKISVITP